MIAQTTASQRRNLLTTLRLSLSIRHRLNRDSRRNLRQQKYRTLQKRFSGEFPITTAGGSTVITSPASSAQIVFDLSSNERFALGMRMAIYAYSNRKEGRGM